MSTRRLAAVTLVFVIVSAGCASSSDPATTQEKFGVRMAKMNLWREAMFRFERAVEMNPQDAMARNNLAVAYEANGDFDNAAKAYREAMRLDRTNEYIQKNYSRFVEFTTRDRRRQQQQRRAAGIAAEEEVAPASGSAPAASETPETPVTGDPEPPTPVQAGTREDGSPAPTAAAPAATPAPNPAPPQTSPEPVPPPGGAS